MDKLIRKLAEEFNYCEHIEFYPFPSITPTLFQGMIVSCNRFNKTISATTDCIGCAFRKDSEQTDA